MTTHDTEPARQQSSNPIPVSIDVGALVIAATRRMRDERIHHLVLLEDDRIVGVVTDRDLIVRCVAARRRPTRTCIRDIMSADVLSGSGAMPLALDRVHPILDQDELNGSASAGEKREGPPAAAYGPLYRNGPSHRPLSPQVKGKLT